MAAAIVSRASPSRLRAPWHSRRSMRAQTGAYRQPYEIVFSATDPNFVVIEATFGLFLSQNTGASFGWLCEPAIGYPSTLNWDPPIGITSTSVLAGIPHGVSGVDGPGVQLAGDADGADRPISSSAATTRTLRSARSPPATPGSPTPWGQCLLDSVVFATHDDGATWTQQGVALEPDIAVETIDIAASDPNTIYVGGARTVLRRRRLGQSNRDRPLVHQRWSELRGDRDPAPAPDRVRILRLRLGCGSKRRAAGLRARQPVHRLHRELQHRPAARQRRRRRDVSYRLPVERRPSRLRALRATVRRVFLGDFVSGVLLASAPPVDSGAPYSFDQRSPTLVECLTWSGGNLYACAPQSKSGYLNELAVSTDDGLTFSPVFRFGCVSGLVACSSDSGALASTCGLEFTGVQALVGPCSDDGGSPADASAPGTPPCPRTRERRHDHERRRAAARRERPPVKSAASRQSGSSSRWRSEGEGDAGDQFGPRASVPV